MELSPETILNNRYRIVQQLGQGGMGAVYLAYDISLEHQVAVKVNRNPSEQSTTQFLREARLLAGLRHPNLPRVIDYFVSGPEQFLVMDYVPGDDLGVLIEKQGAQPLERVLNWAQQIGSALNYLHKQTPPVIHRDVKPSNIKLTNEGEAMLVDFGIAKTSDSSQATAAGAIGYTPGYAPPEQYGSSRTGPYSDQYSLAATLYALLTGQKPVESVERVLGNAVLSPMNLLNPTIPAKIQQVIEKAMAMRPEERFSSIDEFIRALNDPSYQPTIRPTPQLQPAPAPAVVPAPSAKAPPAKRRNGLLGAGIGIGVLVVLLLCAGGAFLYVRSLSPKPAPSPTMLAVVAPSQASQTAVPTAEPVKASGSPVPATALPATAAVILPSSTGTPPAAASSTPGPVGKGGVIAFASDRADGSTFQIWTMKAALSANGQVVSSDPTQVTSGEGSKNEPAWSPDGSRLLYVAAGGKNGAGQDTGLDIFMVNLNTPGSQPVNLTLLKGDDTYPAWSPDGKTIAFTNQGRFNDIRQIYMMNADGSNQRRISFDFEEYSPSWSPDMNWLLYVIFARDHNYLYLRNHVNNFATATPQAYDNKEIFGRLGQVANPAWSPDGNTIAYTRIDGLNQHIYTVPFKSRGDNPNLLTKDTPRDYEPSWSPDSQWITFTSERDHNAEIYVMTAAGLLQSNLTNNPARDIEPAWQP